MHTVTADEMAEYINTLSWTIASSTRGNGKRLEVLFAANGPPKYRITIGGKPTPHHATDLADAVGIYNKESIY